MTDDADDVLPVHFVRRALEGRRPLQAGEPFPHQDRRLIRGYSEAYGHPDDGRPWSELDFVTTIALPRDLANRVLVLGLALEEARSLLRRRAESEKKLVA